MDGGKGLDEAILEEMERRGHSTMVAAARVMGMDPDTLRRFLRGETSFGRRNCERVAGYLGWTVMAVVQSNEAIRARRERWKWGGKVAGMAGEGPLRTYWGEVRQPVMERPGDGKCERCALQAECRAAVRAGRPLPCERFLESELVGQV